jgi:hypothetical protein
MDGNPNFGAWPSEDHLLANAFPLSPYISGLIVQRALEVDFSKVKEVFDAILDMPVPGACATHVFRMLVLERLRNGVMITIKPAKGPDHQSWVSLTVKRAPPGIGSPCTPEDVKEFLEKNEGQLVTLLGSTVHSVDALVNHDNSICMIQVTLDQSHPMQVSGLDTLLESIPIRYHPTEADKAKLFVITLSGNCAIENPAHLAPSDASLGRQDWWERRLQKHVAVVPRNWLYEREGYYLHLQSS